MTESLSPVSAAETVETPWGPAGSLRERKLRPGPGADPEEVAQNQRERLFGAMVASVTTRGYAATTIEDLVEISGVSRRTLYNLFDDKQACFRSAIEAMLTASLSQTSVQGRPGLSWEDLTRERFAAFVALLVEESAAARVALIETRIAGPEAHRPIEGAISGWEQVMSRRFAESAERAEMPPEAITAFVGGTLEICRDRLGRGLEDELPALIGGYAELVLSYRSPPSALRSVPRAPSAAGEAIEGPDHRERALRALAAVVAEKGYPELAINEVISRASMSPATFYGHFTGKEDAMAAAIESAGAQVLAVAIPAFRRHRDWTQGARSAIGAILNFLASRPALARLLCVEAYAAGPEAMACRDRALRGLGVLLSEGEPIAVDRRIAPWGIAAGAYALAYRTVKDRGAEALPALAPICTYLTLAPYIGAEQACRVANEPGPQRRSAAAELESMRDLAAQPESNRREQIGARSLSLIAGDIEDAQRSGAFDSRTDPFLARIELALDEEGWKRVVEIHEQAYLATLEVQRDSTERLAAGHEQSRAARTVQLFFEMPASD